MENSIEESVHLIFEQLKQDRHLSKYIDSSLSIPKPFVGLGKIKLIVLGQDPTVKNPKSRQTITTLLNLNKNYSVYTYLAGVCINLGIDLKENVYATNLYKNFFIDPPTQIKDINIFQAFKDCWLPLLEDELMSYPDIPVITLGQPILAPLATGDTSVKVRDYWGYTPEWKAGKLKPFAFMYKNDNHINRMIFPYPHQPSLRKEFYRTRMEDYTSFVKTTAFS